MGHTINGVTVRERIPNAGSAVPKGQKKDARKARPDLKYSIQKEIEEIRNSNIPPKKKQRLIKKLKKELKSLKNPKGNIAQDYNDALSTLRAVNKSRKTAVNKAKQSGSNYSVKTSSKPPDYSSQAADNSGKSNNSKGASEAFEDFKPERFANLMMDDPDAAMEKLKKMDMKEMSTALQMAQNHLQQVQRMMQLQSNLSKIAHKTHSSVIQNIR